MHYSLTYFKEMKKQTPHVLGISIGTRKIGIAVMKSNRLLEWKVCSFKGPWSKEKLRQIIETIKKEAQPFPITALALKIPSIVHHTESLQALILAIHQYCTAEMLSLQVYSLPELKAELTTDGRKTKKALVKHVAEKYPELHNICKKEHQNRNKHYTKMFEAIAAAELFSKQHHYL